MNIANNFWNFFCFFLYILSRPELLLLIPKNIYLPAYVQYEWLKKFKIGTIIDIGANLGNVTVALAHLCPQADIFAFEPIKAECEIIALKTKHLKNVTIVNSALSNKNEKIPFYVNAFSPTSSILQLSTLGKKFVHSHTTKTIVDAITLDSYFRHKKLKKPIFIKIDVQGAEKIVFKGANNILTKASVIHVETGFEIFYKNQCLFDDIYQILTHHGFLYHGSNKEADFYPLFAIPYFENSIFIKKSAA